MPTYKNEHFNLRLVKEIEQQPDLYDPRNRARASRHQIELAWDAVATVVGVSSTCL